MSYYFLTFLCFCSSIFASNISYRSEQIDFFTTAHILEVDPRYFDMKVARAHLKNGISRETVLCMAKEHGAIAGVNGGFWKTDGKPAGILKILDKWHSVAVKKRGAIGWKDGENLPIFDQVLNSNEEKDPVPQSTPPYTSKEDWKKMDYIVGGTPILVRNGTIIKDFSLEDTLINFLIKKHSRTAVGITKNGNWLFVVIDGRLYDLVGGMKMKTLAKYMLDLGCIEALNLDGGSSSTIVYENLVVNSPHGNISEAGKNVTAVSDAILIFPKD